jgi:molybdopterin-guanine dinucleotide biosynthesis protein A
MNCWKKLMTLNQENMSQNKHQKHAKITRPAYGQFHRQEWAILGTPCGNIQQLAYALMERLSDNYRLGYVDADHAEADGKVAADGARAYGSTMEYTDKINHHRFDIDMPLNEYQFRMLFKGEDAVLVNGNHFKAKRQIVVIDAKKEESLKRKLDRLDNVVLILLANKESRVYPWLKEALDNFESIPQMKLDDVAGVGILLEQRLQAVKAPLYGLVLVGGKSTRMGEDKGSLDYHGVPQQTYTENLLQRYCQKVYVSCRADQSDGIDHAIPDTFTGLGPFGGILSAFREEPEAAWLVLACDLPLVDNATLEKLVTNRNPSKVATAYHSPVNKFPEPLIAIWEPRAYPMLLEFLAQGYSCPRKVLINTEVELLDADDPNTLRNANTPEERAAIKEILKSE